MRCDEALHIKADPIFQLIEFYSVLHNMFRGTKVSYQIWGLRRWVVLSWMWFPLYKCHSLFRFICFNQCEFYLYHRYKIVHMATTEAFWHEDGPAKCLLSNNFKIVREVLDIQISLLIDWLLHEISNPGWSLWNTDRTSLLEFVHSRLFGRCLSPAAKNPKLSSELCKHSWSPTHPSGECIATQKQNTKNSIEPPASYLNVLQKCASLKVDAIVHVPSVMQLSQLDYPVTISFPRDTSYKRTNDRPNSN